ncbi:MAG: universal stress protein [Pseudorhodoplanes sp.]|jgi:nucleotide-binding universal stress UspA family protein|nr:universal stress protein [Pseudorhodoplanes sp.]
MNAPRWMSGPPKKILLATDLSPRCDRALDRAVLLAELWQAKLIILNVLEDVRSWDTDIVLPSWKRPPDPFKIAQRQLIDDVGPVANTATIVIDEGNPADATLRTAEARDCDLIITGVARDEPLGRFLLGTTIDRLLRDSPLPVLVVKNRARRHYHHILVATDFSESSRHALEAADRYFPSDPLTIFHAYDPVMSGLATDPATYRRDYQDSVQQEYDAFLNSIPSGAAIRKRARPLIEFGTPSALLRDYVRDRDIDLVVLGTHGRSAFFDVLIGSVAKQIMEELPCDALVVRDPRAWKTTAT